MQPSAAGGRSRVGWLLALVFLLLATANAGGYRYGASDQAFYVPAVLRHVDLALFPRDRALIDPQAASLLLDEAAAWAMAATGVSLEALFLAGYVVTGLLLGLAGWRFALALGSGPWVAAAFVLALTLRHRVARTGVNTFEGYFHPRVLAFALGVLAVGATVTGRPTSTALLLLVALVVHPTTALWFAVWVGVAWAIVLVEARRVPGATPRGVTAPRLATAAALLAAFGGLAVALAAGAGVLGRALERMDPEWLALLASKDYLFPTAWRADVWALHVAVLGVVALGYARRRRAGAIAPRERPMLLGYAAVVALFAASLPFIAARASLAVQLQTSRVLWGADLLGTFYLAWMLADGVTRGRGQAVVRAVPAAALVALVIAFASAARGTYVTWFERSGRTLVRVGLPATDWTEALAWIRAHTPADAHVLADPGHAWQHDVSVRVGAARDVYLEEVKDTAMALYARPVAARVIARIRAAGSFDTIGDRLDGLIAADGLTHLVAARPPAGPAIDARHRRAWSNDTFAVYELRPTPGPAAVPQARTMSGSTTTASDPRTALVMMQYLSAR